MFQHKTPSTVTDPPENPDHIGGPAWNEVHVPAPGTIFPVAFVSAEGITPPNVSVTWRGAQPAGTVSTNAHGCEAYIDVSDLAAPAGYTLRFFCAVLTFNENAFPKIGHLVRPSCHVGESANIDGQISFQLQLWDAETFHDVPEYAILSALVMAEVIVAP